jgi:tetratricopeptide (TPR) repeat protein
MGRPGAVLIALWILGAAAARAAEPPPGPAAAIARMDQLWATRDSSGAMADAVTVGNAEITVDPQNFEVEWRLARAYFWLASTQPNRVSSKALAVKAVEWAERVRDQRPDRVEGHYYAAVAIGEYASTVGIMQAIVDGVAGKVETAALRAHEIDPDYASGAPGVVLGRYYFLLPWPKRDLERSRRYLEEVVRRHPNKLIARQYLAETYYELDEREQARAQLLLVGSTDPAPDTERDLPNPRPLAAAALRKWFE